MELDENQIVIKEAFDTSYIDKKQDSKEKIVENDKFDSKLFDLLIKMLDSGIELEIIEKLELDIKEAKLKYYSCGYESEEVVNKLQEASYKLMCLYIKNNKIEQANLLCSGFNDDMKKYIMDRIKPSYPNIIVNDNYYVAMLRLEISEGRNIDVRNIKFWEGIYNIEYPDSNYVLPNEWQPTMTSLIPKDNSFLQKTINFGLFRVFRIRFDPTSDRNKMNLEDIQRLKEFLIYKKSCKKIRLSFEEGIEDVIFDLGVNTNCTFTVQLPSSAKRIGGSFFKFSSNVTSVDLSSTKIEIIEDNTFRNSSIKTIKFPNSLRLIGNNAFYECYDLEEVNLENTNLEKIKSSAFYDSGLRKIKLPNTIQTIDIEAFSNCICLREIDFSKTALNDFNSGLLTNSGINRIKCPEKLRSVNFDTFSECFNLQSIDLSKTNVKRIGSYAFHNSKIKNIKLPNTLKEIEYEAFSGCKDLRIVDLSKTNVEKIGAFAFYNSGVSEIKLPESLKTIDKNAFVGCENLKKLNLSDTKVRQINSEIIYNSGVHKINF